MSGDMSEAAWEQLAMDSLGELGCAVAADLAVSSLANGGIAIRTCGVGTFRRVLSPHR